MFFDVKNLDNIISGPQRAVQNKKTEAVHDPIIHVFISIFFTSFSVCDDNVAPYQLGNETRLQPVMSVRSVIVSLTLFLDLHLLLSHLKHPL